MIMKTLWEKGIETPEEDQTQQHFEKSLLHGSVD